MMVWRFANSSASFRDKLDAFLSSTLDCLQPKDKGRIIPILKPTRCTSVSNLFYFRMTLYMFQTVFPSIIGSSRLYIQQQAYVKQILRVPARKQTAVSVWLLYVECTPDDGRKGRPKHVECYSKINHFDTLVHLVGFTIGIILRCTAL